MARVAGRGRAAHRIGDLRPLCPRCELLRAPENRTPGPGNDGRHRAMPDRRGLPLHRDRQRAMKANGQARRLGSYGKGKGDEVMTDKPYPDAHVMVAASLLKPTLLWLL